MLNAQPNDTVISKRWEGGGGESDGGCHLCWRRGSDRGDGFWGEERRRDTTDTMGRRRSDRGVVRVGEGRKWDRDDIRRGGGRAGEM